jgi:hypothetical protein
MTCADSDWVLQGLVWTSWTSTKATATGTFVYNDCVPDCASGHQHEVPSTQVILTDPVPDANGQLVWSELLQHPEPPGYATGPSQGVPFGLPTQAL